MLQKNPLAPPLPQLPPRVDQRGPEAAPAHGRPFIAAEDFDATGILAGMDACESRYWWMPELHAVEAGQATSRDAGAAASTSAASAA